MKLKKCLVILPLLALTLSACNSTKVSEPLDDSSSTSEETGSEETGSTSEEDTQTTLTNYTLSIEIRYNGDVEKVPEYATAYIQGGWDSWTGWVALTENNDRYEYSFASIDLGTYEYQLVLDYDDTNIGYTYRVTQSNASFTVEASDGDNYVNEVTITSQNALEAIIPDPSAAINNVKVTIDITLDGVSQGVLDYGTLWIEGSWDWSEFVACSVEDGKYVYTFTSLAPIEYSFLGVIYYNDEQLPDDGTLWDYKVNGNDCTFTVDSNDVSATLVATKALSEILPPIGGQDNDTYSISVANADSLLTLEYDANATEQQVVVLDISLVTTKGDGSSTSVPASAEDVTFTDYDQDIISISGLTITPLAAGTTSLTISWGEYASTTLNVVVSDTTVRETPGEEDPNLEAAQAILDAAAETEYLEWDAIHAEEYEDEEISAEVYLALDESSNAYGYWYQYDDGELDNCNYYVDGIKYVYEPNEDEGEQYTTTDYGANIDLDTFLDDYSEALEDASDIDLTDEGTTYTLSEDGTTLEVEVTSTNYYGTELTTTYTYVVNEDSEIVGVGLYAPDTLGLSYEGYYAELITYEAVVSVMATEFDITNWTVEEEGLGESITLYFTFTYGGATETLEDYQQIYLNGGWDGGSWDVTKTLEYDETSSQYYVEIAYGNDEDVSGHWFNFNLILEYSDAAYSWDEDSIVLIDGGDYWTHESGVATATYTVELTDTFANLLEDRGAAVVTYVITIKHGETALEATPNNINLYAAGDFNGTWNEEGYYNWGDPVLLENNQNGTYNLVLYELPEVGRSFEILADDTTDDSQDMWGYILGNHTFTSEEAAGSSVAITVTTEFTDWNDTATGVFPPKGTELEEFYVVLYDNSSNFSWSGSHTITFNAQGNYWNSQTSSSCSGTKTTLASGKTALYSEAAYAVSGTNSWFNVKVDNATMNIAASTLPSNEQGIPVYVNYGWFDGWVGGSETWNANDSNVGTWYYMPTGTTIEAFLNSLQIQIS